MDETRDKEPIKFLKKHLIKHTKRTNQNIIATQFLNIDKWIANKDINNELHNFWSKKNIMDSQKTCLLKLKYEQYMGNARKQLFLDKKHIHPSHASYVTL